MFCLASLIFVQMKLYPIVRPLAALAIKTFFRKIHLSNMDRVPSDRPVILAANHPTAFMEPCILACYMDRPLHFLVRGDFFSKTPVFFFAALPEYVARFSITGWRL